MKTLKIQTTLDAEYVFPDVADTVADTVCSEKSIDVFRRTGSLVVHNVSNSLLMVRFSIVARVLIDDKEAWCSTA